MNITTKSFGRTDDGSDVDLYTLTNSNGMKVQITNYGGIVVALFVPDRNGTLDDVVLGYDTLNEYIKNNPYFGAIVGRCCNRIARAKFTIDGKKYRLAANNGKNHLHGGIRGFDKVVWNAEVVEGEETIGIRLFYLSKDGEEGYPGNLSTTVTYLITDKNELKIIYMAKTDKPTVINLTHHSYFNLAGQGNGNILNHILMINADKFTVVDEQLLPTGELLKVNGTPMDFRTPTAIGERIDSDYRQLQYGCGYDHNYVLKTHQGKPVFAARVYEPTNGRVLEVFTTEPGIQFYTGNFLDSRITGKKGKVYKHRYGLCLEAQHFPDSPNRPEFPSVILRPGQTYTQETVYKFSAK